LAGVLQKSHNGREFHLAFAVVHSWEFRLHISASQDLELKQRKLLPFYGLHRIDRQATDRRR